MEPLPSPPIKEPVLKDIPLRRWEVRTAPIAFYARWYTLDVSYRINKHWAVGPAVILFNHPKDSYASWLSPAYNGTAVGVQGNFYFENVKFRTFYISSHLYYDDYTSYQGDFYGVDDEHDDYSGVRINGAFGYRFQWSQFSLQAGGGLEWRSYSVVKRDNDPLTDTTSQHNTHRTFLLPFIEFKLGFEF